MRPVCFVSRRVDSKWECVFGPGGALLTTGRVSMEALLLFLKFDFRFYLWMWPKCVVNSRLQWIFFLRRNHTCQHNHRFTSWRCATWAGTCQRVSYYSGNKLSECSSAIETDDHDAGPTRTMISLGHSEVGKHRGDPQQRCFKRHDIRLSCWHGQAAVQWDHLLPFFTLYEDVCPFEFLHLFVFRLGGFQGHICSQVWCCATAYTTELKLNWIGRGPSCWCRHLCSPLTSGM